MSFRYTNSLIGAIRHRLTLEAAHREIARRIFVGTCDGIEVTCSGYGTVLSLRLMDRKTWEPFYHRRTSTAAVTAGAGRTLAAALDAETKTGKESGNEKENASIIAATDTHSLDYTRLAHSIQTATWEANRLLRAAKEEAFARSVLHNPHLRAQGSLRTWYESDADTLHPRPFDALRQEAATPWMQAVRFAKANARVFLEGRNNNTNNSANAASRNKSGSGEGGQSAHLHAPVTQGRTRVTVLDATDCDPLAIPIGSTHPLYAPALIQLEATEEMDAAMGTGAKEAALVTGRADLSRVNSQAVLSELKTEMSLDEDLFWERVELIRRGQLAAIPNGARKRGYAEMAATVTDTLEDKVDLKFTQ